MSVLTDFIESYLPYYSSDASVAHLNDLYAVVDNEWEEGSNAAVYAKHYEGRTADLHNQIALYERRLIELALEAFYRQNPKPSGLALEKGASVGFLNYKILNSMNNDGLVLINESPEATLFESHLGNFGESTQENVANAKKYALTHYLIRRADQFATIIARRLHDSGTHQEGLKIIEIITKEFGNVPPELTLDRKSGNAFLLFMGKPFFK